MPSEASREVERPLPCDPYQTGFAPETLPWLDRVYAEIDEYVDSLGGGAEPELRTRLCQWVQRGYIAIPGAIESDLIDAYVADVEDAMRSRQYPLSVVIEGFGVRSLSECTEDQLAIRHLRLMDFHNLSIAGKRLSLHPVIVDTLKHLFRAPPVVMQTLTFIHSTEQPTHQDFPYVVPTRYPSHLAATWIALEDVHPDAGPLGYYPGSHALPRFNWGNGLFLRDGSTRNEDDFACYLEREADRAGLDSQTFCATKGDVFFWHSSLAHRGTIARNPGLSRRSLVTHYSTLAGHPVERGERHLASQDRTLDLGEYSGGYVYLDPRRPEIEDIYDRGRSLGSKPY